MSKEEIKRKIIQILFEAEMFSEEEINDSIDTSDLVEYGLESLNFVELIIKIEQEFLIEIPPMYMMIEKWNSIEQICENIIKLL